MSYGETTTPQLEALALTHLKLMHLQLAFLGNSNVPCGKDGIKRVLHTAR